MSELPPVIYDDQRINETNTIQWRQPVPKNTQAIDHAQQAVISVERAYAVNSGAADERLSRRQFNKGY